MTNPSLFLLLSLSFFLTGCFSQSNGSEETVVTISEISADEVLDMYPDANIFQYDGIIYQTEIDWVDELDLTPGEQVLTITEEVSNPDEFSDGAATFLPVGTAVFEANGRQDILIAEVNGEYINYLAIVEG